MVGFPVNPLSKLKLDSWYMVLIPIGSIILISSVIIDSKESLLLGMGLLLVGLGEWKNNKYRFEELHATAITPYSYRNTPVRVPNKIGNILLILGVICIIFWGVLFFNI